MCDASTGNKLAQFDINPEDNFRCSGERPQHGFARSGKLGMKISNKVPSRRHGRRAPRGTFRKRKQAADRQKASLSAARTRMRGARTLGGGDQMDCDEVPNRR
jgi:hypothetical protein